MKQPRMNAVHGLLGVRNVSKTFQLMPLRSCGNMSPRRQRQILLPSTAAAEHIQCSAQFLVRYCNHPVHADSKSLTEHSGGLVEQGQATI